VAKKARKRIGLNMRAELYDDLAKLAKDYGQTTAYVLEQATEHYVRFIAPTQSVVQ
jgi:predicted DNA-binding protein